MQTGLHNKLILHTAFMYFEKAIENECYQRAAILELKTKLQGYRVFHRFSQDEAKYITKLGEDEFMKKLKEQFVDFAVYAIYLMVNWIEVTEKKDRPSINISDTKIRKIKSEIIMDMLRLKKSDSDTYANIKEVIDTTKLVAKQYVQYTKDYDVK